MICFDQSEFELRCEWGSQGIGQLAPVSDAVIIVDVLSFCTSVSIAISREACIFPYRYNDETARAFAEARGAMLAGSRGPSGGYSLSPASLLDIPAGARLVLPSPNGAALSMETGPVATFAGCLRNAGAVARAARQAGRRISLIPAGERWADGSLRPALEDLVGAGAILYHLPGSRSPEAAAAEAAFLNLASDLPAGLRRCGSAKELAARGFSVDVDLAAALNSENCAPMLVADAFIQPINLS